MAFSDFKTAAEVQEKFGIASVEENFVESEREEPPAHFLRDFEFAQQHIDVLASESARCHALIYPILWECYKAYAEDYALWIGKSITYNETLTGTPDYFVATKSPLGKNVVGSPLIMMVQAKRNDFVAGWGQCLAEMVAAQKINDDVVCPVYGIVSDGQSWEFGRLVGETFIWKRSRINTDDLPGVFGAVKAVFRHAKQHAGHCNLNEGVS